MLQPRIVTWRAVSSEEQAEKESLDHQHRLNLEHVARWGGVVVAHLEVPGISRNIVLWEDACKQIEAYAALNELLERRAFDILMCYDVTRLGRDRALIVTTASLCERAGIRIYETASPPVSLEGPHSTADSRLLLTLKGHMSEEETRKFAERATFGRMAQVRKGKHANRPPAGLTQVYGPTGEVTTIIDEAWRSLVVMFFDLYLAHGRSQHAIAREFNARGLLMPGTGMQWDENSIRVFLRNRWAYAGFASWGIWEKKQKAFRAKAEWPGIITEEQARWAEAEMARRSVMSRSIGAPQRFSMVGKCNICGCTMTVDGRAGQAGRVSNSYRCRASCKGSFILEKFVYAAVRAAIISLRDDARLEELIGETPENYTELEATLTHAHNALVAVAKERNKLTLAFVRDAIRLDEYEPLMAELKERHDAIAHTITTLEDEIDATPTAEQRRSRLEEVRDKGLAMLDHPDTTTANAWLRQRFLLLVEGHEVVLIKVL